GAGGAPRSVYGRVGRVSRRDRLLPQVRRRLLSTNDDRAGANLDWRRGPIECGRSLPRTKNSRAAGERPDRSDPLPGCPTRVRRRPTEARPQLNRAMGARIRRGGGAGRGGEDPRISYRPPRGTSGSANEATMTIRP